LFNDVIFQVQELTPLPYGAAEARRTCIGAVEEDEMEEVGCGPT
jgi:hypothetical protein